MNGKNGAIGLNVAKLVGEEIEFVEGPSSTHKKIILSLDLRSPAMTHSLQGFNSMPAMRVTVQVHIGFYINFSLEIYKSNIQISFVCK